MTVIDLERKLKAMLQRGFQTGAQNNNKYPSAQLNYLNQTKKVKQLNPYGFYSATPINSEWIILEARGNSEDKWGFGNIYKDRYKNVENINGLIEGESLMLNVKTGSYILLKADGSIEIDSQNEINVTSVNKITIVAPDVEFTSNIKITGDFEVIGNIDSTGTVKNNTKSIGSLHIHTGVTTGPGVSGPPA